MGIFKKIGRGIKKGFDKVGARISDGGESIARRTIKGVAKRTQKRYNLNETASRTLTNFQSSKPVTDIVETFGAGTREIAKNFAISVASLGVANLAQSANMVGAGIKTARAASLVAKAGKVATTVTKGAKILKTGIAVAGTLKAVAGQSREPGVTLSEIPIPLEENKGNAVLPLIGLAAALILKK
jgi:hypothetical protein